MTTVCEGIAVEYEKNFGKKPSVLINAPYYQNLQPKKTNPNRIRMIYHGGAIPSRTIEDVIQIMEYTEERFELDKILIPGEQKYMEKIKRIAAKNKKIRFLPPVPMLQITEFCNSYDIGLFPLKPKNLNNLLGLPNKFFEFVQALLCTVISPLNHQAIKIGDGIISGKLPFNFQLWRVIIFGKWLKRFSVSLENNSDEISGFNTFVTHEKPEIDSVFKN